MDFYTILLVLCMARFGSGITKPLNVLDFGAVGDGKTDDSQTFEKAWEAVCGAPTGSSNLLIPTRKIFLLKPVLFKGPCKSPNIHISIRGKIIAPSKRSDWTTTNLGSWIAFTRVDGLTVDGVGIIDGQGLDWWINCGTPPNLCIRPMGLKFDYCNGLIFKGVTLINSPSRHLAVSKCHNSTISNINIFSPKNSSNTDGMDITHSENVQIRDSVIGTGDDCIAILSGCRNLNITGITCGPGHGISIGSMGHNGQDDHVEELHIKNCTFFDSDNGIRIKTWQGGVGYARKISFEDIRLEGTGNPINIDQFYCPQGGCANQTSAVNISSITITGIHGTSSTDKAINIACSETLGCTDIVLDNINITSAIPGKEVTSFCSNAHGRSTNVFPPLNCLSP